MGAGKREAEQMEFKLSVPERVICEFITDGISLSVHDIFVLKGYYNHWKNFLNESDFRKAVMSYKAGELVLEREPEFGDRP